MKGLLATLLVSCCANMLGQTFSNYNISANDIAFETSATEADSGIWVAAPYSFTIGEGDKVAVMRSFDNGESWSTDTIYNDVVDPAICTMPDGNVIMVLQHMGFGGSVLELHRSSDLGDHFSYYSALPSSGFGDKPWIGTDSAGHLFATWTEILFGYNNIGFARSDDGGMSWAVNHAFFDPVNQQLTGSFFSIGPDHVCYLTWGEYTTGNIYFTKSNDLGETWSEPVIISTMLTTGFSPMTYTFSADNSPFIGVLASTAHNNNELLFIKSDDGGSSWETSLLDSFATNPCGIIQANGSIHISYTHFDGDFAVGYTTDTRYINSTDGGTTFSDPITLLEGDADLIYSTYIGEYAQSHIGKDTELHITWVRKTEDIGFTHTIIDIPRDTTNEQDTTLAINELYPVAQFIILPDPATTLIEIRGNVDPATLIIINQFGQRVSAIVNEKRIDISQLPAGVYFVTDNKASCSFVKQ